MGEQVVVIGGGLAGLAAATALAERGFSVTIHEARGRLGGRASSFQDQTSGQLVDACQHVSMGCCTNLAHFCRSLGIDHFLEAQPTLYFMTPDGQISPFAGDPLPAPVHLLRSFWRIHYLTLAEKARVAWGLGWLRLMREDADPPFLPWLLAHGQTQRTIDRFWALILVSALNESPERIGLRYARKVFLDGFLRHRRGFEVQLPSVPLGRLYGDELTGWLQRHGVRLVLQSGARRLLLDNSHVRGIELRDGTVARGDWYICSIPFERFLGLLPDELADQDYFTQPRQLESSPITSVHLWYDRPILDLPHVVLIDCVGQWVFNRGEVAPGEFYVQVVVSAARQFRTLTHTEVQTRIQDEMSRLFPLAQSKRLVRARVVTEHAATFSVVPGVDRWRPTQRSPLANLFLAGDWTATGWPATMEGAVRSGYLAAEALLQKVGRATALVQPDLR